MRLEDLYDVPPPEVVLVGGPRDGERMTVPEGWTRSPFIMLHDPLPPAAVSRPVTDAEILARPLSPASTAYWFTGSITDDGLRVYRARA